jgi:hypothetical protein
VIDAAELPTAEIVPLIDPEAPIPVDLSLPDVEDPNPRPAPEVTSLDPWPADVDKPKSLIAVQKKAESLGWQARPGYSRGSVPGAKKGTWKLREEACLWLLKAGRPRMAISWERSPDSQAKGGPAWKADKALEFDGTGNARAYGHLEGRRLL